MSLDPRVRELIDREAIRETLQRYCRGVDRRDLELLQSVYHPHAWHEHGAYRRNAREFAALIVESMGQFLCTSHFLTNQRIELRGGEADSESYVLAVHRLERDGKEFELVMALRYLDRFERRDGDWRIAERVAVHDWSREATVEGSWAEAARMIQGRSDRDDRSYRD
ncbi:MAG: nuclear transport factor 2 family protein [Myxococcales bacterium]|nr:nuclear transport factor 2 family protein [Myxococcales bacterium]